MVLYFSHFPNPKHKRGQQLISSRLNSMEYIHLHWEQDRTKRNLMNSWIDYMYDRLGQLLVMCGWK